MIKTRTPPHSTPLPNPPGSDTAPLYSRGSICTWRISPPVLCAPHPTPHIPSFPTTPPLPILGGGGLSVEQHRPRITDLGSESDPHVVPTPHVVPVSAQCPTAQCTPNWSTSDAWCGASSNDCPRAISRASSRFDRLIEPIGLGLVNPNLLRVAGGLRSPA